MSFDWLRTSEPALAPEIGRRVRKADDAGKKRPSRGLVGWIGRLLARRRANALLRQTVGPLPPAHYEDASALPERLRRDIGLQPPL